MSANLWVRALGLRGAPAAQLAGQAGDVDAGSGLDLLGGADGGLGEAVARRVRVRARQHRHLLHRERMAGARDLAEEGDDLLQRQDLPRPLARGREGLEDALEGLGLGLAALDEGGRVPPGPLLAGPAVGL